MAVGVVRVEIRRWPGGRAGARTIAVTGGTIRVSEMYCPVGRAGPGSAGGFRRPSEGLAEATAGPARRLGLGRGEGRWAGAGGEVLGLAANGPVRARGLPGPAVCWMSIAVSHIRQDSTGSVKRP